MVKVGIFEAVDRFAPHQTAGKVFVASDFEDFGKLRYDAIFPVFAPVLIELFDIFRSRPESGAVVHQTFNF